jgi:hypothetical protein
MKKILLILCLFPILVFSQKSYKIPADSTILNNIGSGKNELVIRNATSNITGGVLTNLGNGVTAFVLGGNSARVVDTIYKNSAKDSIVFTISGIRYAVKDSFNLNTDSQTLSISNDTLTISGGNSVVLPVYVQADSSTINSYDVLNSQNTPPVSPSTGDVYLVGNVPTGAWVGHAKDIAEWSGSAWVFTDGVQGDFLYNSTTALTYIFRSGNWVQTTGIPALNNGNTISSGLRIGTNNARSLTFETNNVNRGRFDSIGRFHIYNLPTSSTSDTFVTKSDLSGKLTKVGQSTFLSGVNTSLFPNGLSEETVSRELTSADIGKLLIIVNDGVILTPASDMVATGDLPKGFGIWCLNPTTKTSGFKVNTPSEVVYLESAGNIFGGGQIVGFMTLYDDYLETTNIFPLSDIMLPDDFTGTVGQLAIPYFLENLGFRGTATLSSGTVIVATDKIKTGYKIYVSVNTPSGTQGFLSAPTGSIVDATSFVINSTNAGDNSTVNWWIAP